MAALLKKRALAEFSKTFQDGPSTKKLHLAKKPLIGSSAAAFVGLLEKCKSSNDALQLLLRISDCLQFQESDMEEAIKKLCEHFHTEEESAVRVKILWLFADIGLECPGADLHSLIDQTISLLKNETSHKVIAQGIATLLKLGSKLTEDKPLVARLLGVARDNLRDTSHQVKCRCLQLLSQLYPVAADSPETDAVLKLLGDYMHSEDARVRREAFQSLLTLAERGQAVPATLYGAVCAALADDYEIVREAALRLLHVLATLYPERPIPLADDPESSLRLADDAFVRTCGAVNDLCMQVRAQACALLGRARLVSDKFLQQTLDKQLMSNMKKKRTGHERSAELVRSGAWATGRRWADDAPRETLAADTVTLLPGGAAGAFVHGLEDEFMEVRTAAVDAVCELSLGNPVFAATSLDFLVDMFNDEIEEVRLRAIDSLTRISHHIVLREDQLETILCALEDYSMDVREGLHRMLGSCSVASKTCLEMCIDKILDNLKRYPQDKRATYRCLQRLGAAHATLVLPLVPRLLAVHPFFDMPQPDVDDPAYISTLILIFNAAQSCSTMLPLLEEHVCKHYSYLRDTMPHLVPHLPIGDAGSRAAPSEAGEAREAGEAPSARDDPAIRKFFDTIMRHIDNTALSADVRLHMLRSAEEQLNRLAEMEPSVSGAANFTALFARTVLALQEALSASGGPAGHALQLLHDNCLKLQYQYWGTRGAEQAAAGQLRLRVAGARLAAAAAHATQSALPAAHAFTALAESLDRRLADIGVEPDAFTIAVFQQLSLLPEAKPGALARVVLPLLRAAPLPAVPHPNINMKMCTAVIVEPLGDTDTVLKFCAGLVTAVALEAEVYHVRAREALRLRVQYPDRRAHTLVPQRAHLRPLDDTPANSDGTENVRLLTKVLISHGVWTEACGVDISLCLAVPEERSSCKEVPYIELCKPVRVMVAPKPIKRGI